MELSLLKRATKGSPITWAELDQNFTNIENIIHSLPTSKHVSGSFTESMTLNLFSGGTMDFSNLTPSPIPLAIITLKGDTFFYIEDGYGGISNETFHEPFDTVLSVTYDNLNNNLVPSLMEYVGDGYGNFNWVVYKEITNDITYEIVTGVSSNNVALLGVSYDVEYFEFNPLSPIGYIFDLKFIPDTRVSN